MGSEFTSGQPFGSIAYWGQALFFNLGFSAITSELLVFIEQHIWHRRVSLVMTNQLVSNFAQISKFRKLISRPIWGHRSDQVKVGHVWYHSIRDHETNT